MDKSDGAVFAQLTYQMLDNNNKETNIENINNTLEEEGLSDWYISPQLSGKDISTFVNESTKQVVISHRGTDMHGRKTKNDISSDVLLGLGAEENAKAFVFDTGSSLSDIVDAINEVGASAADMVAILEALREAGSLRAELIII